jgi:hypothetical protein
MCAPIALGVASAVAGGVGAIGQHQSASAQAAAQNRAAVGNYKYQLKVRERNWDRERFRYNRQLVQYDSQVRENSLAAQRAYAGEQNNLNNIYKTAAVKQQGNLVTLLQNSGKAAASGRSGRSVQRLDSDLVGQFGRNQAIQAESLMGAQMAYDDRTGALRREQIGANNKAYEKVAVNPQAGVAPPPPVMTPGPSGLGLAAGLIGAGISGVQTADKLTPGGLFS